jgi:hypothetical protein
MSDQITFTEVQLIDKHFRLLYSSLSNRRFNISHENTPSFEEHLKFVRNHPYRIWVLVEMNQISLGNFYIQQDNSIGVNVEEEYLEHLPTIVDMISKKWDPLPPIPSLRNKNFFMNVSRENNKLISVIKRMGAKHIQSSYLLK